MAITTHFNLRNPKEKVTTIQCIVRWGEVGNKQKVSLNTGYSIRPKDWNSGKAEPRKTYLTPDHQQKLKDDLADYSKWINQLISKSFTDENFTKDQLRQAVRNPDAFKVDSFTLFELIDKLDHADNHNNYNTLKINLEEFEESRQIHLNYESINTLFYEDFKQWFLNEKKLKPSYFNAVKNVLRSVMNKAVQENFTENEKWKLFKDVPVKVVKTYVNAQELLQLQEHASTLPDDKKLILHYFLICAWTGLRYSDASRLHTFKVQGNKVRFKVLQKKTWVDASIVLLPPVMEIINQYGGQFPQLVKSYAHNKNNLYDIIRDSEIFKGQKVEVPGADGIEMVDRYTLIKWHSGRRSFASNGMNRKIPVTSLMKMTGHSTMASFQKYVITSDEEDMENIEEGFKDLYMKVS